MSTVLTTRSANAQFGSQYVRQKLESGRWQRAARGVLVTHNGPLTAAEHDSVALAAAPPGSALAGLTALRLDGFEAPPMPTRFIVIPPGGRSRQIKGVVAHWSSPPSTCIRSGGRDGRARHAVWSTPRPGADPLGARDG